MNKKTILILIFIVTSIIIVHNFYYVSRINSKEEYRWSRINASFQRLFFENYHWMFNNNVMQYSSYIFLNRQQIRSISIKGLITVNWDSLSDEEFASSDFFCSIMSIKTGKYIEVPSTDIIHLIHRKPKILSTKLNFRL